LKEISMTEVVEETVGEFERGEAAVRIDWRTGRPMIQHDDAFWCGHERRRIEQGLSVPQYCAANALALSTYRHRVSGKKRARTASLGPSSSPDCAETPAFVAVTPPRQAASAAAVEVTLEGMTLRLHGEAADRVLDQVVGRLA
jgi:hypothetical protein